MVSEEKIKERIGIYKNNLQKVMPDSTRLDFEARVQELEWVLDSPQITYQIIGGTPETKAEIEKAIKELIQKLNQ